MNTNDEHQGCNESRLERPEVMDDVVDEIMTALGIGSSPPRIGPSPKSVSSFYALLEGGSEHLSTNRDIFSPRLFGSFVSVDSKSGLLKKSNTFSLCEDSTDVNDKHFSRTKNPDQFFVGDVKSVWSSHSVGSFSNATKPVNLSLSQQCHVQTDSISRGVAARKRNLSCPKSLAVPHLKRNKRQLRAWTKEEDRRLEEGVKTYGLRKWVLVAKHVMTRDNKMCRQRWKMSMKPEIKVVKRGKWSAEEDEQLRQVVSRHDAKDVSTWEVASQALGYNRNIKQIRDRWENYLDPNLRKLPWTGEEDACLLRLQREFGNKWASFTSTLVGRSKEHIRRRFMWLR